MAYFDEKQREMLEGILGLGGIDSDEVQRIIIAAEENNTPITRVFDRVFTNSVESRDSYFKNAIFPDKPFIKSTTAADEEARGKEIGALNNAIDEWNAAHPDNQYDGATNISPSSDKPVTTTSNVSSDPAIQKAAERVTEHESRMLYYTDEQRDIIRGVLTKAGKTDEEIDRIIIAAEEGPFEKNLNEIFEEQIPDSSQRNQCISEWDTEQENIGSVKTTTNYKYTSAMQAEKPTSGATGQKVTDANAEELKQKLIDLGWNPIAAEHEVEMAKKQGKTIDELFGNYEDNDSEGLIEEITNPASLVSVYSLGNYNLDLSGLANFTSDQIEEIKGSIQALRTPLEDIKTHIDGISASFETLNPDTQAKLSAMAGSGMDLQIIALKAYELWNGYIDSICQKLEQALATIHAHDDTGADTDYDPAETSGGGSGNSKKASSSSGGGNGPSGTSGGNKGNKKKTESSTPVYTALGTLTFTALVPLITEFGKASTIQSKLAETYDVVGIFSYEGNYYYKIYDKSLASYYFAPIDGSSNFKTEYKEVLKSDQTNMMLKTPAAGEDVLAKMSDPNEVYFVNGTAQGQGELKEITFANVFDQPDGKNYYVALNDTTKVVTVEDFVNSAIETAKNTQSTGTVNVG